MSPLHQSKSPANATGVRAFANDLHLPEMVDEGANYHDGQFPVEQITLTLEKNEKYF